MKALVLTGGFGIKLKEVIADRPKVMAPIGGRPFLEFVIENLRRNGIDQIVISLGYLGDFIRDYFGNGENFGIKIEYSQEARPLGTGGAVKLAAGFFSEPFIVVNGDTYFGGNLELLWNFHIKNRARATIVLSRRKEGGEILLGRANKIKDFSQEAAGGFVNCGVYILNPGAVNVVKNKTRFSLEKDVFPKLAKQGSLYGFCTKESFIDIGTSQSYQEAQKKLSNKRQKTIEAVVPTRISFAGGGTDLPEYFAKYGGAVMGSAIGKYAHVRLKTADFGKISVKLLDFGKEESYSLGKYLPYDNSIFDLYRAIINKLKLDIACEISVWGDFPAGSGLGSSSAICEAVILAIHTLKGEKVSAESLARESIDLERSELNIPGGWQDQYLCSLGGFCAIEFKKSGKVVVSSVKLTSKILRKLEENLLMFHLGGKRREKIQQKSLLEKIAYEPETTGALASLGEIAREMRRKLEAGDVDTFGKMLDDAWELKKRSSGKISNDYINRIYDSAKRKGAYGGKLLGAGGGGYLLLYCPRGRKNQIIGFMKKYKLRPESVSFDMEGARVRT